MTSDGIACRATFGLQLIPPEGSSLNSFVMIYESATLDGVGAVSPYLKSFLMFGKEQYY